MSLADFCVRRPVFTTMLVMLFVVTGVFSYRDLSVDLLPKADPETVDGVGEVTISGGQAREIQVILDIEKLNAHGLTVDRVRDAIVSENVEVPGGYIQQGDAELSLRTLGRLESTDQFSNIVVTTTASGTPVRLRDVAVVEDTTAEARTGAFFDGQRTLVMDVRRQSGQNTVQVVEAVRAKLGQLRRALPPGVKVTGTRDHSPFICAPLAPPAKAPPPRPPPPPPPVPGVVPNL